MTPGLTNYRLAQLALNCLRYLDDQGADVAAQLAVAAAAQRAYWERFVAPRDEEEM